MKEDSVTKNEMKKRELETKSREEKEWWGGGAGGGVGKELFRYS